MTLSSVMKQVVVSVPMAGLLRGSGGVHQGDERARADTTKRQQGGALPLLVNIGHQAPRPNADLPQVSVIPSSARAGDSALEALVDAAAGILSADSLPGTLGRIAHHLAALVPHDDLSLYEIEEGGAFLK